MHSAHLHRARVGREGLILGILVLVLFFCHDQHRRGVLYQMCGVSPEHYSGSLAGYFCGITLAALAMNLMERIASARWSAGHVG